MRHVWGHVSGSRVPRAWVLWVRPRPRVSTRASGTPRPPDVSTSSVQTSSPLSRWGHHQTHRWSQTCYVAQDKSVKVSPVSGEEGDKVMMASDKSILSILSYYWTRWCSPAPGATPSPGTRRQGAWPPTSGQSRSVTCIVCRYNEQ